MNSSEDQIVRISGNLTRIRFAAGFHRKGPQLQRQSDCCFNCPMLIEAFHSGVGNWIGINSALLKLTACEEKNRNNV